MNEWDDENVIITGSSDGVVRVSSDLQQESDEKYFVQMWTIGYDQVLDEPATSPSMLAFDEDRSRVPSISQPAHIRLQSNPEQVSMESDLESDEGEGKRSTTPIQINQFVDDEGESNTNKENLNLPTSSSLNSPTGSDKFILVTDVEILEAKNASETPVRSTYLDLKEGLLDRQINLFN